MKVIGLVLLFLLGLSFINFFAYRIKVLMKIGFGFPLGLGISAFIMFLMDVLGLKANNLPLLVSIMVLLIAGLNVASYQRVKQSILAMPKMNMNTLKSQKISISLPWIFFMVLSVLLLFILAKKALFWPTTAYDSVNGYDFLAKALSAEGTLRNAIFDPEYRLDSVRSRYPPLFPTNLAYAYIIGFESSKIVVTLYAISLFIISYAFISKYSTHLAAAFFSLLLMATPEFAAFCSLSSPNPPCALFSAFALISFFVWYTEKDQAYFNLGLMLVLMALWIRTETVVFAASSGLLVLANAWQEKRIVKLLLFGGLSLVVMLAWQLYLSKVLLVSETQPLAELSSLSFAKFGRMWVKVKHVMSQSQYYGIMIYLFLAGLAVNLYNFYKNRSELILPGVIVASWVFYLMIYFLIDTDYSSKAISWIESGYKRGFFYFLPAMLFFVASSRPVAFVFRKYLS